MAKGNTKVNKHKLSKKMIDTAEMLLSPDFNGTITELCEKVGVTRKSYYSWMKNQDYIDYLNEEIEKYTDAELSAVWKALLNRCKAGEIQAIKLYFELKNKYQQNINHTGNITFVDDLGD